MMKASNSCVKPEPLRAQGTVTCRVLPHWLQATRGMAAWMKALCSKKRRCSQLRCRVSWTGWSAAPQQGHSKRLPGLNATSKSICIKALSNCTFSTCQGASSPSAIVKRLVSGPIASPIAQTGDRLTKTPARAKTARRVRRSDD